MDRPALRPSSIPRLLSAAPLAALLVAATAPAQHGVAYIYENERNEIARYDLASGARSAITAGIGDPRQVAVRGGTAWIGELATGELSAVDLSTGAITTVATGLGQVSGVAPEPTHGNQAPRVVYVATRDAAGDGLLLAVDTASGASLPVASGVDWEQGSRRGSIAISPDGATIYGMTRSAPIVVIDVATGTQAALNGPLAMTPTDVAVSPDGARLLVSDFRNRCVWEVDLTGMAPAFALAPDFAWQSIGITLPMHLAISPNGARRALALLNFNSRQTTVEVWDTLGARWTIDGVDPGGVTFGDDDTLLLTQPNGALVALDLPSVALSNVDAGVRRASALDVGGSTAFVWESGPVVHARREGDPTGVELGPRILAVDLQSGDAVTVVDNPLNLGSGLRASRDGSRIYYLRYDAAWNFELVERDVTNGATRQLALIPDANLSVDIAVDEHGGFAYLSIWRYQAGVQVKQIDIATGLTVADYWSDPLQLTDLDDFVVDSATGRAVGTIFVPSRSNPALGVLELVAGQVLVSAVYDAPAVSFVSRPSADGSFVYVVADQLHTGSPQLLATDTSSPIGARSLLLTLEGGIGAFCVRNTADGANVVATPVDPTTGSAPVTLTFDDVVAPGDTTVTTSTSGPAIPAGFQLGGAGIYYEIHTSADFDGNVEICIDYSGTTYTDESTLQLLHYENGAWVNVTTTRDPDLDRICGVVQSFSPFVVVEWLAMNRLNDLMTRVRNLDVRHGIVVSLDAKLAAVEQALSDSHAGNGAAAIQCMQAFLREVRAQRGRNLPVEVADELIADAEAILALLGA